MSWSDPVSFAEAPFGIIDGDRGKNYPKQDEYYATGHCLFLSATNVTKSGFDFSTCQFIDEKKDAALNKGKLQREDIVLTTRGTIGNAAYFNDAVAFENLRINSGMVILRCDREKLLPAFLYHFLRSPSFYSQVNGLRSGVAQPQLPIRDMQQIKLSLPPLPTQRRIASILSAYDELIENNQRRIRILEDMARSLYREWFVHFRYPGYESVPLVDSPLGRIPQGWEVKKLGKIAAVNRAQINAKTAPAELHYIDIASVSPGQIDNITTYSSSEAPGRARRIVQHGDILWSCVRPNRRSHALVMQPEPNTIASTGFAVLTAMDVSFTFLYFATTTDDFVTFLSNSATGSAYPAVTAKTFENAELLVSPASLLAKFGVITVPMAEQVHALQRQTANLRRTRDLLLPRLLSGQVTLSHLPDEVAA